MLFESGVGDTSLLSCGGSVGPGVCYKPSELAVWKLPSTIMVVVEVEGCWSVEVVGISELVKSQWIFGFWILDL